jgi:Tol biopolymer transport system component
MAVVERRPLVALVASSLALVAATIGGPTSTVGGTLVYQAIPHAPNAGFGALLTHDLSRTGQSDLLITRALSPDFPPRWSADGTKVAYVRGDQLYVATGYGVDPRRLLPRRSVTGVPAWSPDGRLVAVNILVGGFAVQRVVTVDVESGAETLLRTPDGVGGPLDWSHDGRTIAIGGDTSRFGEIGILVAPADGSPGARIVPTPNEAEGVRWSPSGRELAFWSYDLGPPDPTCPDGYLASSVWTVRIDGSPAREIAGWSGNDRFPIWSPDGTWLAFVSERPAGWTVATPCEDALETHADIWLVHPNGAGFHRAVIGDDGFAAIPVDWLPAD